MNASLSSGNGEGGCAGKSHGKHQKRSRLNLMTSLHVNPGAELRLCECRDDIRDKCGEGSAEDLRLNLGWATDTDLVGVYLLKK